MYKCYCVRYLYGLTVGKEYWTTGDFGMEVEVKNDDNIYKRYPKSCFYFY